MRWSRWLQNANGVWAVSPPPGGFYPNGNTDEGFDALLSLTTGIDNTATGFALFDNTTGGDNTATGFGAFQNNTDSANTASGALALESNTTGVNNTADGFSVLCSNTSGSDAMAGICMRNGSALPTCSVFR